MSSDRGRTLTASSILEECFKMTHIKPWTKYNRTAGLMALQALIGRKRPMISPKEVQETSSKIRKRAKTRARLGTASCLIKTCVRRSVWRHRKKYRAT